MYFASFIFQMHKMHTAQCSRMQPSMHRLKIGLIVKGWTVYILSCIIWRFHSRSKCKNWLCEYIQMTRNCKFAWAKSNGRLWCIRRCVWSGIYIIYISNTKKITLICMGKIMPNDSQSQMNLIFPLLNPISRCSCRSRSFYIRWHWEVKHLQSVIHSECAKTGIMNNRAS